MAGFLGLSEADLFSWVILPILIFFARVADVTLGTLRIIFVSRGKNHLAPILGFFEVLIWVIAIGQLVQHLHSATSYLGYAAGFATGNFVGMMIENRLAIGTLIVRTILDSGGDELMKRLHEAGYGVTSVKGEGAKGEIQLIYTVVKRKHLKEVIRYIHEVHPKAFISIEDVRSTEEGIFPVQENNRRGLWNIRKGK